MKRPVGYVLFLRFFPSLSLLSFAFRPLPPLLAVRSHTLIISDPTLDPKKPARRYGTKTKPGSPPAPSLPPTPKLLSPSTNGSSDVEQEDDEDGAYGIPQMRGLTLVKRPVVYVSYSTSSSR